MKKKKFPQHLLKNSWKSSLTTIGQIFSGDCVSAGPSTSSGWKYICRQGSDKMSLLFSLKSRLKIVHSAKMVATPSLIKKNLEGLI